MEERWWKEKRRTDVSDGEPDLHSGFLQLIRTIAKAVRGRDGVRGREVGRVRDGFVPQVFMR